MPLIESGVGNQPQHSFAPLVNIFAKMLERNFGVKFPDINAAPILFKTVKHLGLPRMSTSIPTIWDSTDVGFVSSLSIPGHKACPH